MAGCRSAGTANAVNVDPIIHLWLLRILVPLGGHRELVRPARAEVGIEIDGIAPLWR
jgi:hypothetical protein